MPASGRLRRVSRSIGAARGLCAAAALAAAGAASAAEFANPHGVAVVIGNRTYTHERVPDVDYAHRDADAFHRYVVDVLGFDPENVVDLRDASKGEMETAFGNERDHKGILWRYLDADGGSDVVVFYSGHGVPGLEDGRGYLLPADADPNTAHINGYAIDTLYANLAKLEEARSVRVFLDACFSGGSGGGQLVTGFSGAPIRATLRPDPAARMTALTAATGDQVASWDREAEHGMFTHHLLDALYGAGDANGDGDVTAREARNYLRRFMSGAVWSLAAVEQNAHLLPALRPDDPGAVLSQAPAGGFPPRPQEFPEIELASGGSSADTGPAPDPDPLPDAEMVENALGLGFEDRVAVQTGLESLVGSVGHADGVFGDKTRTALRRWQAGRGLEQTGYLTRDQADALAAAGRKAADAAARARAQAEADRAARARAERERDDGAFASARRANTVAAFDEYLASFPSGRHREDARRLRDEAAKDFAVGEVFRDCDHYCPEMVVVPAGRFTMGSPSSESEGYSDERPQREVAIGAEFAVGVHEVTFAEWDACVSGGGCGGYRPDDEGWGRGGRPVINVSWDDAQAYASWLSRETGEEYRLLSEAEWEYVARAGTTTSRYWGSSSSGQCSYANGADRTAQRHNSDWTVADCDDGHYRTAPVGSFRPNGFGLHDVLGNVWEWVEDCWHDDYTSAPRDGRAWLGSNGGDCSRRVLRGGSWDVRPKDLRSANRSRNGSGGRSDDLGFRLLRSVRTFTP